MLPSHLKSCQHIVNDNFVIPCITKYYSAGSDGENRKTDCAILAAHKTVPQTGLSTNVSQLLSLEGSQTQKYYLAIAHSPSSFLMLYS